MISRSCPGLLFNMELPKTILWGCHGVNNTVRSGHSLTGRTIFISGLFCSSPACIILERSPLHAPICFSSSNRSATDNKWAAHGHSRAAASSGAARREDRAAMILGLLWLELPTICTSRAAIYDLGAHRSVIEDRPEHSLFRSVTNEDRSVLFCFPPVCYKISKLPKWRPELLLSPSMSKQTPRTDRTWLKREEPICFELVGSRPTWFYSPPIWCKSDLFQAPSSTPRKYRSVIDTARSSCCEYISSSGLLSSPHQSVVLSGLQSSSIPLQQQRQPQMKTKLHTGFPLLLNQIRANLNSLTSFLSCHIQQQQQLWHRGPLYLLFSWDLASVDSPFPFSDKAWHTLRQVGPPLQIFISYFIHLYKLLLRIFKGFFFFYHHFYMSLLSANRHAEFSYFSSMSCIIFGR